MSTVMDSLLRRYSDARSLTCLQLDPGTRGACRPHPSCPTVRLADCSRRQAANLTKAKNSRIVPRGKNVLASAGDNCSSPLAEVATVCERVKDDRKWRLTKIRSSIIAFPQGNEKRVQGPGAFSLKQKRLTRGAADWGLCPKPPEGCCSRCCTSASAAQNVPTSRVPMTAERHSSEWQADRPLDTSSSVLHISAKRRRPVAAAAAAAAHCPSAPTRHPSSSHHSFRRLGADASTMLSAILSCLGCGTLRLAVVLTLLTLLQLLPWSAAIVYRKQMSDRIITTRYGKVRGILVEFPSRHLRPVEAYFGLRYADLDQGNMRFMPPKNPKEQWMGVRSAVHPQPVCPQLTPQHEREYAQMAPDGRAMHLRNITPFLTNQGEDCLTLNLYVPIQAWNDTTPMPVMVFIHGESYESGTGNAYDGSVLASFGDVIVVTLNYRLGVLGFLTTLDQSAMANLGLLDITQALLWLQENIASFYGDPKRVTLFGHGHGAALVNLLLLSPFVSEGRGPFFQQAIIQSGSALSTWAVSYDPLWCTNKLALKVNCSSFIDDTSKLIGCLRQRSFPELLNAAPQAPKYYSCFAPAVDEWTVLPKQVEQLIKEKQSKFASVPVMFGITKNEAYSYLKQQEIHKGVSDFRKTQIVRTYVQNVYRYHRQKIYEILDHAYTDWTQTADPMSNRNNVLELLSDGQYVAPLIQTANYHAETADTYLYAFSYSTQSESTTQDNEDVQGIHGDELPYVFGSPLVDGLSPFPSNYNSVEKMMSEAVMTYWTNFAKSGNPNEPRNQTSLHGAKVLNRFVDMRWPPYEKSTKQYMLISRRPAIRHHYRGTKLATWLELIPKINQPDGSDPSSHLLSDSHNQSTFDDSHRLIPPFSQVFPSPPPMPPISPTMSYPNDDPSTLSYLPPTINPDGGRWSLASSDKIPGDDTTANDKDSDVTDENKAATTISASEHQQPDHVSGSVPLSITVAVGCTLLFLNLLIFAAVCYQRERIWKLRQRREQYDPDDVRLSRKVERETKLSSMAGPETDSLMSAATGVVATGVNSYGDGGFKEAHEDSPGRVLGGEGGADHSAGTLGRRSPPNAGKKGPSNTSLQRGSADTSNYNYVAVPTHSTSPAHRTHLPGPGIMGMANSIPSYPIYHSHPPPPLPSLQMNTFANNSGTALHGGKGTRIGSTVTPRGMGSEAADTGLYKVINKAALPPQPRDSSSVTGVSSANNAITIV